MANCSKSPTLCASVRKKPLLSPETLRNATAILFGRHLRQAKSIYTPTRLLSINKICLASSPWSCAFLLGILCKEHPQTDKPHNQSSCQLSLAQFVESPNNVFSWYKLEKRVKEGLLNQRQIQSDESKLTKPIKRILLL